VRNASGSLTVAKVRGQGRAKNLAKQQSEAPPDATSATEHLDMMIRRIAMDSMTEIGRVIRELENIGEMLRNESETRHSGS
jgi:hypothetical protein